MLRTIRKTYALELLKLKYNNNNNNNTSNTMSHYYGELTRLSNGLSEIVLKASSESKGICNYESGRDYEYMRHGKKISYSYLAPWDRLDCRILFYLGAPLDGIAGKIGTGGVATLAVLLGAAPVLLVAGSVIGITFAGGQILVALVAIFMAILLMMVILWMCYVFILSLVALSVIIILSPLFIPMVLFQYTKGYFDGWVKELITYSLYPVILFAFLSFMFIACDKICFKVLKFEPDRKYDKWKRFALNVNGCTPERVELLTQKPQRVFVRLHITEIRDWQVIATLVWSVLLSLLVLRFTHCLCIYLH
jgi:type IV secretion system protein VirB6